MAQLLAIGSSSGGGGGEGLGEFIFADFGTQDTSQGRYLSWTDLMAKLATIQLGAAPVVRLAFQTGPFVVPSVGKPALGWDMRGGRFASFYGASGSVVLDCGAVGADVFDNLFGIGTGADPSGGSVFLKIAPPPGTGVLNFSALPIGAGFIFGIGGGCAVDHSTTTGALMRSPGLPPGTTMVVAAVGANQNVGLVPPLTGPLIEFVGDDGAVGVQQMAPNGLPDGWLVGGGVGSLLLSIYDIGANPNTTTPATWVPGFTGGGGVITPFPLQRSALLYYDDALAPAPAIPLGVADVQAAIDALKNPSNYIPSGNAFPPGTWAISDPASMSEAIDRMAALLVVLNGGPIP